MTSIDPITREIIQNGLASVADEMAMALYRTAYSTVVRDCLDFSTSLCDGRGEQIAQGVTIPLHMGAVPEAIKALLDRFDGRIEPGDVFILNDPFEGGMHLPDIFIIKPIFWQDQRVAFAVATAHHLDVGGRLPGSSACDNVEIFQDGIRIPWLKLYRRGEPDESIFALLRANVRVPRILIGDIRAQLAACHIGQRGVLELVERYGVESFNDYAADLIDYTERLLRAEIASWPDGSSTFIDHIDSDGCERRPVKIQLTVTVDGDALTADFTGTAPQVRGAINATYSFASSAVAMAVRCMVRAELPNTAGMFKPLKIIAPAGTVINGEMPAASSMRGVTGFRMVDVTLGALAGILPDRVLAACEGGNSLIIIGGETEAKQRYVYYELLAGTWGGRPDRDGNDGLCNPANISSNIPVEQAECEYPLIVEQYGLAGDSGGPGRFRGGMAVQKKIKLLGPDAHLTMRSDRRDHPPYGLSGGKPGAPSTSILSGKGEDQELPVMVATPMSQGQSIYHRQPGGGGWGDPFTRDPDHVAQDVANDRVSVEAAAREYGVVVDPQTFAVDQVATESQRAQRRS